MRSSQELCAGHLEAVRKTKKADRLLDRNIRGENPQSQTANPLMQIVQSCFQPRPRWK